MVRTFDGHCGGREDCARYTLTSYNENRASGFFCKSADIKADLYWPSASIGNKMTVAKAGYSTASGNWYWCNVMFDPEELAELRAKDVKSVILEAEATLDSRVDIDMKKDGTAKSMIRCDKDGTAIKKTKLGTWASSSPNYVSREDGVCTFDLTDDVDGGFAGVPEFGYCWGRNTSNNVTSYSVSLVNGASILTTSKRARLYVVTNEREANLYFDAEGGSGEPSTITGVGADGIFQTVIPDTVPTKSQKTFQGWALTSGGTVRYQPGDTITVNGDTTLYAKWSNHYVHVLYLPGTGGTGSFDSYPQNAGSTVNIVNVDYFIKMPGKKLKGYSDTDGGTKQYDFGDQYTLGETDKTFYGVWEIASYTIHYDANGGTGAPSDQTKTGLQPLTLSSQKPGKNGFLFKGWSLVRNGEVVYQPGDIYDIDESKFLYAVWEEMGGYVHVATHQGVKTAKAYVKHAPGMKRASVYVMTEDGLKECK